MCISCTMKHYIILDFLDAFQPLYKKFMTFITDTGSAHYYYCVKSGQFAIRIFLSNWWIAWLHSTTEKLSDPRKLCCTSCGVETGKCEVFTASAIGDSNQVYTNHFIIQLFWVITTSSCWLWIECRPFPSFSFQGVLCRIVSIAGQWAYDFVAPASPLGLLLFVLVLCWLASGSGKETDSFLLILHDNVNLLLCQTTWRNTCRAARHLHCCTELPHYQVTLCGDAGNDSSSLRPGRDWVSSATM